MNILKRIFIGVSIAIIVWFLKSEVLAAEITPSSTSFDARYTNYTAQYDPGGNGLPAIQRFYTNWGSWVGTTTMGTAILNPGGPLTDTLTQLSFKYQYSSNFVAGNTYTFNIRINVSNSGFLQVFKNYAILDSCRAGNSSSDLSSSNVQGCTLVSFTIDSDNDKVAYLTYSVVPSVNVKYIWCYFGYYYTLPKYIYYYQGESPFNGNVVVRNSGVTYSEGLSSYIQQTTSAVLQLFNQNSLLIGDDPATWYPSNNYDVSSWESAESSIGSSMEVDVSGLSFSGFATPFSWVWDQVNSIATRYTKIFTMITAFLTISFIGLVLGRS